MPNKPTTVPQLDTNQTNRTVPAGSKVSDGYLTNDILPAANANYLWGWAGDWLNWLDGTFGDGAAAGDVEVGGDWVPSSGSAYDLGTLAKPWQRVNVFSATGSDVVAVGGRSLQPGIHARHTSGRTTILVAPENDSLADTTTDSAIAVVHPYADAPANDSVQWAAFRVSHGATLADTFHVNKYGDLYTTGSIGIGQFQPTEDLHLASGRTAYFGGAVEFDAGLTVSVGNSTFLDRVVIGDSGDTPYGGYKLSLFSDTTETTLWCRNDQAGTGGYANAYFQKSASHASGTITNLYNVRAVTSHGGAGNVTDSYGIVAGHQKTAGSATRLVNYQSEWYSLASINVGSLMDYRATDAPYSGTLNAHYGLYVDNLTLAPNNYGVYVQGASTYAIWADSGICRFDEEVYIGQTPSLLLRPYGAADTDITALISGTNSGGLIESQQNAQIAIGIRGNDNADAFSIISYNDGGPDYDYLVAQFRSLGWVGFGAAPRSKFNVAADADVAVQLTSNEDITASGMYLGGIIWEGKRGALYHPAAAIRARSLGATWSAATANAAASALDFYTQDSSGSDLTAEGVPRMTLDSQGQLAIGKTPTVSGGILQLGMSTADCIFVDASSSGTPSTAAGWIKVNIGGTDRWIQCYSTTP